MTGWRSSTKSDLHCKVHTSCELFQVFVSGLCSIVWYIDVREYSMHMETCLLSTGSGAINTDNRNLWHCRILTKFGITNIEISNWISEVEITVHNSYRKHHFFLGVTPITWFHPLQKGTSVTASWVKILLSWQIFPPFCFRAIGSAQVSVVSLHSCGRDNRERGNKQYYLPVSYPVRNNEDLLLRWISPFKNIGFRRDVVSETF